MRKQKHQFHCEKCNSGCTIYRKGKKHRVLVCPRCGVLATNPFSAGGALTGAATGATLGSVVPGIGTAAGAAAGGLIGGFLDGGQDEKRTTSRSDRDARVVPRVPSDRYTTQERVHDALGGRYGSY